MQTDGHFLHMYCIHLIQNNESIAPDYFLYSHFFKGTKK